MEGEEVGASGEAPAVPAQRAQHCAYILHEMLCVEMITRYRQADKGASGDAPGLDSLDALGFRLGHKLATRLSVGKPLFTSGLDRVKFTCKEVWTALFGRPVSQLKTNHRGVFVLHDSMLRWISRIAGSGEQRAEVQSFIADSMVLPCAIIRGALHATGAPCSVSADASAAPAVMFTVRLDSAPA